MLVVEASFADHHNCRLGKWYEGGKGKELFGHTPSFAQLAAPHEAVHVMEYLDGMLQAERNSRS